MNQRDQRVIQQMTRDIREIQARIGKLPTRASGGGGGGGGLGVVFAPTSNELPNAQNGTFGFTTETQRGYIRRDGAWECWTHWEAQGE